MKTVSFFVLAAFLFALVFTGFWYLWKRVCIEGKPGRDLILLILAPFLSLVLIAALWWNSPTKDSNWNPWFVISCFFITAALFTNCLYSMVKGRYRLLSALGVFVSGLAVLPECALATTIILGPFMK